MRPVLVTCWSVKGGSGTTVVAAALALSLARRDEGALLVDLAGDVPAALGCPEPTLPCFLPPIHAFAVKGGGPHY